MVSILSFPTHRIWVSFAFSSSKAKEMAPKQPTSGLFVGSNKGHVVTRKELAPRPSSRKGVTATASVNDLMPLVDWLRMSSRVTPGNLQASLISAETKEDGLISVIYLGKSSVNGPNGQSFGPQNSVEPVSGTDQLENIQRKVGG